MVFTGLKLVWIVTNFVLKVYKYIPGRKSMEKKRKRSCDGSSSESGRIEDSTRATDLGQTQVSGDRDPERERRDGEDCSGE